MNKIPYTSQNMEAKTLPCDVCVFDCFGWLSHVAVHSDDCQFDSRVKWWIRVSSIVTYSHKNSFWLCWNRCKQCSESWTPCYFWSTVSKRGTHFEHSFLIDKCSCKMVNILPSDIFNSSAISHNFNLLLAKTSLWSIFGVFQDNWQIWASWTFSIIFVCMTVFKVSIPPLNHCFWQSRVQITLIKPLLCLNSIFPIQKGMLYQHMKFRFFHCFENLQH